MRNIYTKQDMDDYIAAIAKDPRTNINSVVEHILHHADELNHKQLDSSWIASMQNLLLIAASTKHITISDDSNYMRLLNHYTKNSLHNTPPPQPAEIEALDKCRYYPVFLTTSKPLELKTDIEREAFSKLIMNTVEDTIDQYCNEHDLDRDALHIDQRSNLRYIIWKGIEVLHRFQIVFHFTEV